MKRRRGKGTVRAAAEAATVPERINRRTEQVIRQFQERFASLNAQVGRETDILCRAQVAPPGNAAGGGGPVGKRDARLAALVEATLSGPRGRAIIERMVNDRLRHLSGLHRDEEDKNSAGSKKAASRKSS
jgi:hypothetical protein